MKRSFWRYLKQDMKLKNRLLLNNMILVLVPAMLILTFFYHQFYLNTIHKVLELRSQAAYQGNLEIEEIVNNMIGVSDVSANDQILDILTWPNDVIRQDSNRKKISDELTTFQAVLDSHIGEEQITDIRIYCDAPTDYLNGLTPEKGVQIFAPLSDILFSYWHNLMEISGKSAQVFPGYYLTVKEREDSGEMAYVRRHVYYQEGEKKEAFIAVYHSSSQISDSLAEGMTLEHESAYIIDAKNVIVGFTNAYDMGVNTTDYEEIDKLLEHKRTFQKVSFADSDVYMCYFDVRNTDWRLVWLVPASGLLDESKSLLIQFIGAYLAVAILAFILSVILTKTISWRIYYLQNQMRFMKEKRPVPIKEVPGSDEIGELIVTYNEMVERINSQVDKEIRTAEDLNEAKIQALRAQIDPHFLYNTLDMVKWMAASGKSEEVSEVVVTLSRFYRLTLNKGKSMVTVQDELEQVTLYVQIMNKRFDDRIEFLVDVPDEMMEYVVPMLIFQPVVENAIIHGILEKEEQEGNVTIIGWEDDKYLYFEISDDGIGMSEDMLEDVRNGKNTGSGSGIGVYNTNRRLRLLFQDESAGLTYTSKPGEGTAVQFCLPLDRLKKEIEE